MKFICCIKIRPVYLVIAALLLGSVCVLAATDGKPGAAEYPVLMYHQVSQKESKLGDYVVSVNELKYDIKRILEEGYTPIFASELLEFCRGGAPLPEKPILLTFDDGYMSDYVYVLPLLREYNIKANFAIVGGLADLYSSGIDRHVDYAQCTWDEIREMHESGLTEFLSHSYNMHDLKKRKGVLRTSAESHEEYKTVIEDDIAKNKKAFIDNLGYEPVAFVYPFGSFNQEVEEIINSYFDMTFGAYEKHNYITGEEQNLYLIRRYNMSHNRNIDKILK